MVQIRNQEISASADSVNSVDTQITSIEVNIEIESNSSSGEPECTLSSKTPSISTQRRGYWKRFLGLLLTVVVSLQFSLGGLIFSLVSLNPFNFVFWSWTGMMAMLIVYMIVVSSASAFKKRQNFLVGIYPFGRTSCFVLLQAIFRTNAAILIFYGFRYILLADATVIYSSTPVFVTLLAFLFLREPVGLVPIVTIALVLVGVGIIAKPPLLTGQEALTPDTIFGVGTSFGSMLLMASSLVLLRQLREVSPVTLNMVFMSWGWLESGLISYLSGDFQLPADLREAGLVALSAVLVLSAQIGLVLALKYEQAGPVALLRTTEVIFAFLWQILFLGSHPDVWSLSGGCITLVGIVLVTLRKMVGSLPDDHKIKTRFRFLLL